jgi:hypothetical protein
MENGLAVNMEKLSTYPFITPKRRNIIAYR